MMEKMKTTAPVSSVGADGGQPNVKKHNEMLSAIRKAMVAEAKRLKAARP